MIVLYVLSIRGVSVIIIICYIIICFYYFLDFIYFNFIYEYIYRIKLYILFYCIFVSDAPSPDKGVDGYTLSFSKCACAYDQDMFNCACCQNNGCQCGEKYRNQCVHCGHLEQCGNKAWIFGPPFNTTR